MLDFQSRDEVSTTFSRTEYGYNIGPVCHGSCTSNGMKCESSSIDRVLPFQGKCCGFEPRLSLQNVDKGCVCHNNLCKGEYTLSRSRITANTVHFQCTDEVSTTFSCTELQKWLLP